MYKQLFLTAVICGLMGLGLSLAVDNAGGTVLQVDIPLPPIGIQWARTGLVLFLGKISPILTHAWPIGECIWMNKLPREQELTVNYLPSVVVASCITGPDSIWISRRTTKVVWIWQYRSHEIVSVYKKNACSYGAQLCDRIKPQIQWFVRPGMPWLLVQ